MSVKIYDSTIGAFKDAETPLIWDEQAQAWKGSTGLVWNESAQAWQERWGAIPKNAIYWHGKMQEGQEFNFSKTDNTSPNWTVGNEKDHLLISAINKNVYGAGCWIFFSQPIPAESNKCIVQFDYGNNERPYFIEFACYYSYKKNVTATNARDGQIKKVNDDGKANKLELDVSDIRKPIYLAFVIAVAQNKEAVKLYLNELYYE